MDARINYTQMDDTPLQDESTEGPTDECSAPVNMTAQKPKVFIRMSRSMDETYYGIDRQLLLIKPIKSHRVMPMSTKKTRYFSVKCDDLLYKVSQEETFNKVALEMTDRAMLGISGVLLSVGILNSGKSYSLFGDGQNLGIMHKVIGRMHLLVNKKCSDFKYKLAISCIDIDNNVVKDCLSGGKVLVDISQAKRKFFDTVVGGFVIIMKALGSITNKCNTIIYIYIKGERLENNMSFTSKLTFAEIASTIPRIVSTAMEPMRTMEQSIQELMSDIMRLGFQATCVERNSPKFSPAKVISSTGSFFTKTERVQDIPIRKDLFILEDMFITFAKKSKEQHYYEELKAFGLSGKMERPKFIHKQFLNNSKLAVALSDLLTGTCDLRVLVHLVPRGEFIFENLKVLRFAVRASIIPVKTKMPF